MQDDEFADDPFSRRADSLFHDLESDTERLLDPPPASQIRRLGDRRRTRRRAGMAAGALGVTAVVAASALTLGNMHQKPDHAQPAAPSHVAPSLATATASVPASPTATPAASSMDATPSVQTSSSAVSTPTVVVTQTVTPSATQTTPSSAGTPSGATSGAWPALSWPSVPGVQNVYLSTPGDLKETEAVGGADTAAQLQSPITSCDQDLTSLDARSIYVRTMAPKDTKSNAYVTVAVFDFVSADQAAAARGAYRSWMKSCAKATPPNGYTIQTAAATEFPIAPSDAGNVPTNASYRLITFKPTSSSDPGQWQDITIMTVNNRMVVLDVQTIGQDHNCVATAGGTAPQCTAVKVAPAIAEVVAMH